MSPYSLIEYKLRQYIFLGHESSMYVPPPIRNSFWYPKDKYYENITGVRIIAKIVNKNKAEEIDSIVPIILKVKKEGKLHDDRLLIFTLAVCTKFNMTQCAKMVADANAAVSIICTDGLKFLMFIKFCQDINIILYEKGYISYKPSGFGSRLRKTINNWYLKNDPFELTKLVLKHKCFEGWTHRDVMNQIHIHSKDPGQQMIIIYILHGIKKVKEIFELKLKDVHNDGVIEQLKLIYEYINNIHNIPKMNEITLKNEIECNKWSLQIIPSKMLRSTKILTSLVIHMPLSILLDNTCYFAKQRLFRNSTPHKGLKEYISRFNNPYLLKESKIHPIESFVEYVKYSRRCNNILTIQHNICKKKKSITDTPDKLKVFMKTNEKNTCVNQTTNEIDMTEVNQEEQYETNDIQNKPTGILMFKPCPRLVEELLTFLSEDLIKKTLENLIPSNRRILISYDSRMCMKTKKCFYTNLLGVDEAITLIILSLIYPETLENKPTIFALKEKSLSKIEIDYNQSLTFSNLESVLYKENKKTTNSDDSNMDHLSSINWARQNKQNYDLFVLLGTNQMNLRNIKKAIKKYQKFSQKTVKVIVCCLNGKHSEQSNLKGNNNLFIAGFDKYIGKVIDGFIKEDF
ncbi:Hypothetical protein CINCED_3A009897 [Cinara cedri]|uniref:TROVE domain-containing protein n=1 Tax=Cinara cedri TaxID=506608 RepID=A0A5E4MB39_9HEMI|nr:Hypothetical protein CINCED_3A009897 [Cinara cedri]